MAALLALSCQAALAHSLSATDQVSVDVIKDDSIPNATFSVTSSPFPLPFEITTSSSFFSVSVSSNTTPATVTIQFNQSLAAQLGESTGSISITMPELLPEYDLRETVEVRLLVRELGAPPLIRTNRNSFSFTALTSGPAQDVLPLRVSNAGGEPLIYSLETTYAPDQPSGWLDISPMGGSITTTTIRHTFNVLSSSLPPGNYSAEIKIEGNTTNSPQFVSVSLEVTEPPLLTPNPFQLDLTAIAGRKTEGASSLQIQNLGGGSVTYLMTLDVPWLKIVPLQSTIADDPIEHVVSIDATGMAPGDYSTVVPIQPLTAGIPSDSVLVNLTLTEPPVLDVSPPSVSLSGTAGSESIVNGVVIVTPELEDSLQWTAQLSAAKPWLEVTPSGPTPGVLRLRANASALEPGVYTAEISLSAQAAGPDGEAYPDSVRLPITFAVSPPGPSPLLLSRQTVLLESHANAAPSRRTLGIRSGVGAEQPWSIATDNQAPWLSVNASQGSTPALLELSADSAGLAPGLYQDTLELVSGAARERLNVAFSVADGADAALELAPRGLTFDVQSDSLRIARKDLWATNTGSLPVSWNVVFGNGAQPAWLTLSASSGTVNASESTPIEIRADPVGLQAGVYSSLLRVDTSDGASRFATMVLHVTDPSDGPQPWVQPTGVILQSPAGAEDTVAAEVQLTEANGGAAQFQAAAVSTGSWLSLSEQQGAVASGVVVSLTATANPAGLAVGPHRGEIVVHLTNGQTTVVPVLYIIRPAVTSTALSQDLSACADDALFANLSSPAPGFEAQTGFPFPVELEVTNACGEAVAGLAPSVEFSTGEPSIALKGIGGGSYVGVWAPQNAAKQVTASAMLPQAEVVSATGEVAEGGRTWIGRGGVVNGADFVPRQTIAPGSIVSLFGDVLAPEPGVAPQVPLPTALSQTSVLVDGVAAPLFAVFPQQINLQVPYETAARRVVDVVVMASGQVSVPERVAAAESQPGIFELPVDFDGPHRAAAINQDGSLNSSSNPASSGSVVTFFLTGQGPLSAEVATGAGAPAGPDLARATLEAGVTLDGQPAQLEFVGLTPGFVGLLQANVRLGEIAAEKTDVEAVIRIGEQSSAPLLISVKP